MPPAALATAAGVWRPGVLRFDSVFWTAPGFTRVVTRTVRTHGGGAIAVLDVAPAGASLAGPVVATRRMATGRPAPRRAVCSPTGPACRPLSRMRAHVPAVSR